MRIFYGWIIAATILTVWAISIGPRQSFGSTRSAISGIFSAHMACYAVGGWGLGILLDRVGPKRIIAWSTAGWALVLIGTAWLTDVWQLYLVFGVLGGIGTGGLAYVANNALISRWFVRYRGLASGIAQAAVPLGTTVFGALSQLGIGSIGWRDTYLVFGVVVAVTSLPLVLFVLRDTPQEMGLAPDGVAARAGSSSGSLAWNNRDYGFTGPGFPRGYWDIFCANFLRGLATYAILVHQVAYLVDIGFSRVAAASFFSTSAFLAIPGGLTAGAISDRIGRPKTYAWIGALFAIGYASLLFTRAPSHVMTLWLHIVAIGVANGGVSPVFAALLTDRLQGPRLGFLLGLQNIGFGVGAALAPYLAGAAFDLLGGYTLVFALMALAMIGSSAIVFVTARRTPMLGLKRFS
jgi:OFA family oxalate/formate antiporter-like MFS transporter